MWFCQHCNERVDDTFDVCWNCGTARDGKRDEAFKPAEDVDASEMAHLPQLDITATASQRRCDLPPGPGIRFRPRTLMAAVTIAVILVALSTWYIHPHTVEDFYRRGVAHMKTGEYADAVREFTHAIERFDDDGNQSNLSMLYALRAAAFHNQQDYAKSLRDISRAIALIDVPMTSLSSHTILAPMGNRVSMYVVRAHTLIALGENEEAIADLDLVLQHDPDNRHALDLLAIAKDEQSEAE